MAAEEGPGTGEGANVGEEEIVLLFVTAGEEPLLVEVLVEAVGVELDEEAGTGTGVTGTTSPFSLIFFIRMMKLRLPHWSV